MSRCYEKDKYISYFPIMLQDRNTHKLRSDVNIGRHRHYIILLGTKMIFDV